MNQYLSSSSYRKVFFKPALIKIHISDTNKTERYLEFEKN